MTETKIVVDGQSVFITPKMLSFIVSINQSEYEVFCKDEDHNFAIARIVPHTADQGLISIMQSALETFRKDRRYNAWDNMKFIEYTEQDLLNTPEKEFTFYSFDDARIGVLLTDMNDRNFGYVIAYGDKRVLVNAEYFHDRKKGGSEYIYLWSIRDDKGKLNDEVSSHNVTRVIRRHNTMTDPETKLFFV